LFGLINGLTYGVLFNIAVAVFGLVWNYIVHGVFLRDLTLLTAMGIIVPPLLMLFGVCIALVPDKPARINFTIIPSAISAICAFVVATCAVVTLLLRFWKEIFQLLFQLLS
jgi:hypothetical protein